MPRAALAAHPSAPIILLIRLLPAPLGHAGLHPFLEPLPQAGLVALGLRLALPARLCLQLPSSPGHPHPLSPLHLCLPAPLNGRLWDPLNWS